MFNKVVLVGTIGTAPEFTQTDGVAATFPLATSTRKDEGSDDLRMTVDWHRIAIPTMLLNECRNLKINDIVLVEGELTTSPRQKAKYEDGTRLCVYSTEVFAHTIKILMAN